MIDVAGVGFWQDSLRIWINEGDLNFSEEIVDPAVNQLEALEAADVDGDGDIDILVDDVLYKNNGSGVFDETQDLSGLVCLAVLVLPGAETPAACNLLAPIVINPASMRGKQVVQINSSYSALQPLEAA